MMIRRTVHTRSGITLTEILISIMIMAVGIVSLATLFPLGLLRLREAARLSRSGYLVESASGDLGARNLLAKPSFLNTFSAPWYITPGGRYDPWIQDTPSYKTDPFSSPYGVYSGFGSFLDGQTNNPANPPPTGTVLPVPGPGLPVAYDPLWRFQTGTYLGVGTPLFPESRFASGIGFVRNDPNPGTASSLPSAHGLQRITNFNPAFATSSAVPDIFVSPEDVVLQSNDAVTGSTTVSPIVPDMTMGVTGNGLPAPQYDWRYTWMVTGRQADATDATVFDCDIVIFENRPFQLDNPGTVVVPFSSATVTGVVAGEPVVEAIFGYSNNVLAGSSGTVGYAVNANRAVLLRWPDSQPDPDVKVGSWIADVTYERAYAEDLKRAKTDGFNGGGFYPYQRCYWYQVGKRTPAGPGRSMTGDPPGVAYREMSVWTTTPLRAFTLLSVTTGDPFHVNAALVSPYVVNVYSRTVYTR